MFDPVDPSQSFPDLELGILQYWQEEDVFKRSMERRKDGEVFNFYDGPPFATGLPHYGHILAGTIKDVIPRYHTMRGKHVKRRFGWDCHGLPVENEIEKEKNLKSKKDIEELGIAKFNDYCRTAVQRFTGEWRSTVERLGRFVDMDWDYRTMDPDYMESIWWVFGELYKQGLIYEGHKPMHVCPRCQTPLSNFEVTQGYKDIQDYSVYVKLELEDSPKTFLLVWTTTAWTLPGNVLAAINPEIVYVKVESNKETFILAKDLVASVFKNIEHTVKDEVKAKSLIGKKYKPLFPYYIDQLQDKGFRIVSSDLVTVDAGTGIVHEAPAFGEDDFYLGQREQMPIIQHVGTDGIFKKEVTDFAGLHAKPKDDHQSGDKAVAAWLKAKNKLFKTESFMHSYPHCWRCDSPLLNYATSSWFVAVEKIKEKMLESNAKTSWVPSHIKDGRFGKWLEGARDWAISRNRFWGTPLPIWKNSLTGAVEVIGSRDDLMARTSKRFTKVIVARHGESQGNVDAIYQGKEPGTALTEQGETQVQKLGERIAHASEKIPVAAIYCSPLLRTQMTAKAIADATGIKVIIDDRLREVNFGEYEGKHIDFDDLAFIRDRRAHKMETGQVESIFHFHGMETWSSTTLRAQEFLDEVLKKHKGETIVIVTHADLVMNFTHLFTGLEPQKIVHQPYPDVASHRTFYFDHQTKKQMDLHKQTVDDVQWKAEGSKAKVDLTLVRHGETDFNKQKLMQGGNIDMPLNKVGKAQVKALAEKLQGSDYDVIVSSDLKRATESAKILSTILGVKHAGSYELLRERGFGTWSGKPVDELLKKYGPKKTVKGLSPIWLKSTPEDGESFDAFTSRIRRAQDFLLKEFSGKRVLLISHGGVMRAMKYCMGSSYEEAAAELPKNAEISKLTLLPHMRRIDDVLDCWFESGSMPYAQEHFPFENQGKAPSGFPADFIAEGLDQTRGWFYTLMVLSTALFNCPPFKHCIVNGIVLAEDGKKMSKRLKNYPEPTEIVKKHGADAVRFALMGSPAVRGEDLRFSEKLVSEIVRSVLLPLWNAYRLFVTTANGAEWKPSIDASLKNAQSTYQLDQWIVATTQELVNKVTHELDSYDLSATCAEIADSIDDLTNWYVRLSRRRLAGKEEGQKEAFDTLYRVLLTLTQLLAPFCPFVSENIYLNLVEGEHDSVHFTDWPASRELSSDEQKLLTLMQNTRTIVRLGLSLRADTKIRVRQPLQSASFALPPSDIGGIVSDLIAEELNVKHVIALPDVESLATTIVQVDARKVGPRLGGRVQDIIKAGKAGEFEERDSKIVIMNEEFTSEEAKIVYQSKEGQTVAASHGIVVTLNTHLTDALALEGEARELIHAIQVLRKDAGLEFTDTISLQIEGADTIMQTHEKLVLDETRAVLEKNKGKSEAVSIGERKITVNFNKKM